MKSIHHQTRSLAIEEEIGNRQGAANNLNNLGNSTALASMTRPSSTTLARSPSRRRLAIGGRGRSLGNLGTLHLDGLHDAPAALNFLERAAAAYDAIWDDLGTTSSASPMATCRTTCFAEPSGAPMHALPNPTMHCLPPSAPLARLRAAARAATRAVWHGAGSCQEAAARPGFAQSSPCASAPPSSCSRTSTRPRSCMGRAVVEARLSLPSTRSASLSMTSHSGSWSSSAPHAQRSARRSNHECWSPSLVCRDLAILPDDEDIDEAALSTAISSTDASSVLRRCYELLIAPFADVIAEST